MKEVLESGFKFVFGNSWDVVYPHFDSTTDYRDKCLQIQGTKAVDTIAVKDNTLYFFEIKNYNGSWLASKKYPDYKTINTFTYYLAQSLSQKLRDTVACQIFIDRAHNKNKISNHLTNPNIRIKYIIFIEGELSIIKNRIDLLTIMNHEVNRHIKVFLKWAKIDLLLINSNKFQSYSLDLSIIEDKKSRGFPTFASRKAKHRSIKKA